MSGTPDNEVHPLDLELSERITAANLREQPAQEGAFRFVGIDDHYFLSIAMQPGNAKVTYTPVTVPPAPIVRSRVSP